MILSYCPKKGKSVILISTMHNQPKIDDTAENKKPEVILYYNSTKGGVDAIDKMVRSYSCKRMTRRWSLAIFYNMIDIS
jgi:predicted transposase YbfD/YdcC